MVEMDVGCRQISDLGSPVMRPAPLLPSPFARHLRARASARDSYSLRDFDSFQPSSKMKQPALFRRTVSFLVEMARVEPRSSKCCFFIFSSSENVHFTPFLFLLVFSWELNSTILLAKILAKNQHVSYLCLRFCTLIL